MYIIREITNPSVETHYLDKDNKWSLQKVDSGKTEEQAKNIVEVLTANQIAYICRTINKVHNSTKYYWSCSSTVERLPEE